MDTCFPQDGVVTGQVADVLAVGWNFQGARSGESLRGLQIAVCEKKWWSFRVIQKAQAQLGESELASSVSAEVVFSHLEKSDSFLKIDNC